MTPDIPRPKGRGQDAVGKPAGATIGARPKFTLSTTASATGYSADLAGLDPEKAHRGFCLAGSRGIVVKFEMLCRLRGSEIHSL